MTVHNFDSEILMTALIATFENRHTDFAGGQVVFTPEFASNATFEKRWKAFCNKIKIDNPPSFQEVMRVISDFVKPYWEKLLS